MGPGKPRVHLLLPLSEGPHHELGEEGEPASLDTQPLHQVRLGRRGDTEEPQVIEESVSVEQTHPGG